MNLPRQVREKVKVYGDDIGFQFSSSGMGARTKLLTIKNIRRATPVEIQRIQELALSDWSYRGRKTAYKKTNRTAKRHGTREMPEAGIYTVVGTAQVGFEGESPRRIKVFTETFRGNLTGAVAHFPVWYSYGGELD